MSVGACNILIVNARDLPALIKEWRKHKPNIVPGVNTLFNGLMNQPSFADPRFQYASY
jgi:long-chain acyl-CoA synthetase